MAKGKGKNKDGAKTGSQKFESLKDKTAPVKSEKINKMAQMTEKKRIEIVKDAKKGVPFKYAIAIIAVIAALAGVFIFTMPGYVKPAEGPVKSGDVVQIFYTLRLSNGSVFDSGNFTFKVGAGEAIPGVDEAVIGMKVGGKKTVTVKPDKAYGYYDESKVFDVPLADERNVTDVMSIVSFNMTFGEEPVLNKTYNVEGMAWGMKVTSIRNGTVTLLNDVQNGTTFDMKDSLRNVYAKGAVDIEGDKLIISIHPIRGSQMVIQSMLGTYGVGKIVDFNETSMKIDFNHPLASETLTFDITLLNSIPY